jgi:hypothetical protein
MIQDYSELPVIERSSLKIGTFIDLATSTNTRADFTVIATCSLDEKASISILNILRGRWEWPDARERIIEEILAGSRLGRRGDQRLSALLLSGVGPGEAPSQRHLLSYPISVNKGKVSHALLCSARRAAGKLFYRKNAFCADFRRVLF